jgi:hypothetical protein
MDSLPQPIRSLLFSCSPQRSCKVGGPFQARALCVPAARISGFFVWTRMGSLRSPGDPSRASAALLDPGRTDVSSPSRPHRCCPRFAHNEGFGNCISGLPHAASAPAVLRFAFRVATHAQGWLPAGWLAFAGRASNPLDRYERFQLVLTVIPLSCSPDASAIALLRRPHPVGRNRWIAPLHPNCPENMTRVVALRTSLALSVATQVVRFW